jgi:hypothetical protein
VPRRSTVEFPIRDAMAAACVLELAPAPRWSASDDRRLLPFLPLCGAVSDPRE